MPVSKGSRSARTCNAITISSSDALPARSPMPLIVHSTWRAPASAGGSLFATPRPVRRGTAEVLVMGPADYYIAISPHALVPLFDEMFHFARRRVADGVGYV